MLLPLPQGGGGGLTITPLCLFSVAYCGVFGLNHLVDSLYTDPSIFVAT